MVKPTPVERIKDILDAISRIKQFLNGIDQETFANDVQLQSAVLFQFLILGEAVRHIDKSILEKYPFKWHIPISFRNFIAHEYHGLKMERIYLAANDLDEIDRIMKMILEKEF